MASRGTYERRGNLTSRTVREKAGANKPITRREMRAAFEVWKAEKAKSPAYVCSTHIAETATGFRERLKETERITKKGAL